MQRCYGFTKPLRGKIQRQIDGFWLVGMHGRASQLTKNTHRKGPGFQVPLMGTVENILIFNDGFRYTDPPGQHTGALGPGVVPLANVLSPSRAYCLMRIFAMLPRRGNVYQRWVTPIVK
jgi:hypothetical protein